MDIHIFWHITSFPDYQDILNRILSRQHTILKESGLWDQATRIHVGIIGQTPNDAVEEICSNSKVSVIAKKEEGYEDVTLKPLHQFCKQNPDTLVLYIHCKGITRAIDSPAHDYTTMMEHFLIGKWRECVNRLENHSCNTIGCQKWIFPKTKFTFYEGNFWWARSSYIATLPCPYEFSQNGTHRHRSEYWCLINHKNGADPSHWVMHYTGILGKRGRMHHYKDHYPKKYYTCTCCDNSQPCVNLPAPPGGWHGDVAFRFRFPKIYKLSRKFLQTLRKSNN